MPFVPVVMVAGSELTNAAVTYYTCPALKKTVIQSATAINTTSADHTVTVHRVPSGGTASNTNKLISARTLGPGEAYQCPELLGKVLGYGDTIQALADAGTSISLQIAGMEVD